MGRRPKHPICSFEIKKSLTQDLIFSIVCSGCGRIGLIDKESIDKYISYFSKDMISSISKERTSN
jgi:hypothetical protein